MEAREAAIQIIEQMPEDRVVYALNILENIDRTFDEELGRRRMAYDVLQTLRESAARKGLELDYDRELATYREEKFDKKLKLNGGVIHNNEGRTR